jgi:hypothetical protein
VARVAVAVRGAEKALDVDVGNALGDGLACADVRGQAAARACSQRSTVALAWSTAASGVAP